MVITSAMIEGFKKYLEEGEKSEATVSKYVRDVTKLSDYCSGREITKELLVSYKQDLLDRGYAAASVNSVIAAINSFTEYAERPELRMRSLRIQRKMFRPEEEELSVSEYKRLCAAAENLKCDHTLNMLIQAICSTGIRVSELKYITVEAVKKGKAVISLKGKTRVIFIPNELREKLIAFCKAKKVETGAIFISRRGKPIDRTTVWRRMKRLCIIAGVDPGKVYPHNLRHLFARVFYETDKDIVKLADVLGHSNIETTRIYMQTDGSEHVKLLDRMRLIM